MGEPSASGREAGFLNVSTATCVAAGMVIFDRDVQLLLTAAHPPIPAVSGDAWRRWSWTTCRRLLCSRVQQWSEQPVCSF